MSVRVDVFEMFFIPRLYVCCCFVGFHARQHLDMANAFSEASQDFYERQQQQH